MGLNFSQIEDAALLTQNLMVKRGAFVDMQTDLTDHVAVREMWKGRQKKFDGGENWDFSVQMDHNHSTRAVGLYEQDGSSLADTMVRGEVGPRHINSHYIYDLREKAFQRGGTAIVDLIQTRYTAMMVSLFEYLEEKLWSKPTDSSDLKTPYGVAYWVTRSATEGFNGGNPAGFSGGRAGISSATYPRFSNYTAEYATISKQDLIRKMRKAMRLIGFKSVVNHSQPEMLSGRGIYMNQETIGLFEELVEAQNMSLGNDLASKDGQTLFKSTPLTYVPKLDDDSTDPVYMLDWRWLAIGVMPGWENNLGKPYMVPGKHLVRRVDHDATLNTICTDPRRQAVINK